MKIRRLVTLVLARAGADHGASRPGRHRDHQYREPDRGLRPGDHEGGDGSTFAWKNNDPTFTHTSTQNSPLSLWPTGSIAPGATKSTIIRSAGSYPYHCSIHPTMTGSVKVPVKVSPTTGTTSTTFTITVATVAATSPFIYDVQIKVGAGAFGAYATTESPTGTFHAPVSGTYAFRSRLHNMMTGATSGYSPARTITVS